MGLGMGLQFLRLAHDSSATPVTASGLVDAQQCRNGGQRGVGGGRCLDENYPSEFKAQKSS